MTQESPVSLENHRCPLCDNIGVDGRYILSGICIEDGDKTEEGFDIAFCEKCFESLRRRTASEVDRTRIQNLFEAKTGPDLMSKLEEDPGLPELVRSTVGLDWIRKNGDAFYDL